MAKIQAYCGLDCGECEAYIATQKNDRAGLEAVAKKWAAEFGGKDVFHVEPRVISRDGNFHQRSSFAAETMLSTVIPNPLYAASACAEAPNECIPMNFPRGPR